MTRLSRLISIALGVTAQLAPASRPVLFEVPNDSPVASQQTILDIAAGDNGTALSVGTSSTNSFLFIAGADGPTVINLNNLTPVPPDWRVVGLEYRDGLIIVSGTGGFTTANPLLWGTVEDFVNNTVSSFDLGSPTSTQDLVVTEETGDPNFDLRVHVLEGPRVRLIPLALDGAMGTATQFDTDGTGATCMAVDAALSVYVGFGNGTIEVFEAGNATRTLQDSNAGSRIADLLVSEVDQFRLYAAFAGTSKGVEIRTYNRSELTDEDFGAIFDAQGGGAILPAHPNFMTLDPEGDLYVGLTAAKEGAILQNTGDNTTARITFSSDTHVVGKLELVSPTPFIDGLEWKNTRRVGVPGYTPFGALPACAWDPATGTLLVGGDIVSGNFRLSTDAGATTISSDGAIRPGFITRLSPTDLTPAQEFIVTVNSDVPRPGDSAPPIGAFLPDAPGVPVGRFSGATITVQAPEILYLAADGSFLDETSLDAEIPADAVTRYTCLGFSVDDTEITGDGNRYSFVVEEDTSISFRWRVEHAVTIANNLSGTRSAWVDGGDEMFAIGETGQWTRDAVTNLGLESPASGNPSPVNKKHWIEEDELFTAFIDGTASDSSDPNTRYIPISWSSDGSAEGPAGVFDGTNSTTTFDTVENRQQVPQFVVVGPASIIYNWGVQHRAQIGVTSEKATGLPLVEVVSSPSGYPMQADANGIGTFWFHRDSALRFGANDDPTNNVSLNVNDPVFGTTGQFTALRNLEPGDNPDHFYPINPFDAGGTLTWNYQETIFRLFATIGDPIRFLPTNSNENPLGYISATIISDISTTESPAVTSVLQDNAGGATLDNVVVRDGATGDVFPVRPGRFLLSWKSKTDPGTDYATEIVSGFGQDLIVDQLAKGADGSLANPTADGKFSSLRFAGKPRHFRLLAHDDLPPIPLDPSAEDGFVFGRLLFTETSQGLSVANGLLEFPIIPTTGPDPPSRSGRHVLEFTESAAEGHRTRIRVLETREWDAVNDPVINSQRDGAWGSALIAEGGSGDLKAGIHTLQHGRFAAESRRSTRAGPTSAIALEDLNGDQVADFLEGSLAGDLNLFLGSGNGTFADLPVTFATGSPMFGIATGDLDQDGDVEVVLLNGGNDRVLENNGDATFGNPVDIPATGSQSLAGFIRDFDNDGNNDLVAARVGQSSVHFGNGDLSFNPIAAPLININSSDVAVGDLNEDGFLDCIIVADTSAPGGAVTIALNNGDRTFATSPLEPSSALGMRSVALEDLDGDGRLDLILAPATGPASVFLGAGDGTFSDSPLPLGAGTEAARSIETLDLNADSLPDVVMGQSAGTFAFLNRGSGPTDEWLGLNAPLLVSPSGSDELVIVPADTGGSMLVTSLLDRETNAVVGERLESPRYDLADLNTAFLASPIDDELMINVDPAVYDRQRLDAAGPIFPVNKRYDLDDSFEAIWFESSFGINWPWQSVQHEIVWPNLTLDRIVIASRLGSEGVDSIGDHQLSFDPARYSEVTIYNQPDRALPGFNPNEEHSLIAPSFKFLDSPQPPATAYALRDGGWNVTRKNHTYTSEPLVLVQFFDGETGSWGMKRYKIFAEQRDDLRYQGPDYDFAAPYLFPEIDPDPENPDDQRAFPYEFHYEMLAGEPVQPPYPLGLVIGLTPCKETTGQNASADGRLTYWEDHRGTPWAVSEGDLTSIPYYPLPLGFWAEEAGVPIAPGTCIGFGAGQRTASSVRSIRYSARWPSETAVLKLGETLTFAGGEYKADNPSAPGLPGVVGWASGQIVFDSLNPTMAGDKTYDDYAARLLTPLVTIRVPLALSDNTKELISPANGITEVDSLVWRFSALSASLKKRIFFDPLNNELGLQGFVNDKTLGDASLTAAPDPVYVLEAAILTTAELSTLESLAPLSELNAWGTAVADLYSKARNPLGVRRGSEEVTGRYYVGLQQKTSANESYTPSIMRTTGDRKKSLDDAWFSAYHPAGRRWIRLNIDGTGQAAETPEEVAAWGAPIEVSIQEDATSEQVANAIRNANWGSTFTVAGTGDEVIISYNSPSGTSSRMQLQDGVATGIQQVERFETTNGIGLDEKFIVLHDENGSIAVWFDTVIAEEAPSAVASFDRAIRVGGLSSLSPAIGVAVRLAEKLNRDPSFSVERDADDRNVLLVTHTTPGPIPNGNTGTTGFSRTTKTQGSYGPAGGPTGFSFEADELSTAAAVPDMSEASNLNAIGPGLALAPSAQWLDPTSVPAEPGYLTLVENSDPDIGGPVTLHIVKIDPQHRYRGAIKTVLPPNIFEEKITLRHTADFGGNDENIVYQWFYREEDGTEAAVPPGAPWKIFPDQSDNPIKGEGMFSIDVAGMGGLILADNLFFLRYRHVNDVPTGFDRPAADDNGSPDDDPFGDGGDSFNGFDWTDTAWYRDGQPAPVKGELWAGAGNSPTVDGEYRPQLVQGWIKRVLDRINPYEARFDDFRSNDAPATYVSMILQAGQTPIGPVALNPDKDVIENVGLLELYQTVLDRGIDLSIGLSSPITTPGVNNALQLAAGRLNDLYMVLGNAAYADAQDSTIGFGSGSAEYGSFASSIHPFTNMVAGPLEEELALLRGISGSFARPVFNRLFWNFTKDAGEAAYALNYNISDQNLDGFVDERDGQILYPQGHGDAWGHYTSAARAYYNLLQHPFFNYQPRSELYNLLDIVIPVDFLDERKFASAAASRAKAGAEIVDLTYRSRYTSNPDGQWQGYTDTDEDRAWGVQGWARRSGQGALFDWITANAVIPATDERFDTENDAIPGEHLLKRVDRSVVPAIKDISAALASIQNTYDDANAGQNPLGLAEGLVPFDIDPTFLEVGSGIQGVLHFEQIYERALIAANNALAIFDAATEHQNQIRGQQNTADDFFSEVVEQDRDYRNRLIEVFGTPYEGQIGPGLAYPSGYRGPDILLYPYVEVLDNLPNSSNTFRVAFDSIRQFVNTKNDPGNGDPFREIELVEGRSPYFLRDVSTFTGPADPGATRGDSLLIDNLPIRAQGYAFAVPGDGSWGSRGTTGELQQIVSELLIAETELKIAIGNYDGMIVELESAVSLLEAKHGLSSELLGIRRSERNKIVGLNAAIRALKVVSAITQTVGEITKDFVDSSGDAIDVTIGFSNTPFKSIASILKAVGIGTKLGAQFTALATDQAADVIGDFTELVGLNAEIDALLAEASFDLQADLGAIESSLLNESTLRLEIANALESLRSTSNRYRSTLADGFRLLDEREDFNKTAAGATQRTRYQDMAFRVFRNDALQKYAAAFDLAARYAYMAAQAYDYDTNLHPDDPASAVGLIDEIIKARALGEFVEGEPLAGSNGLAGTLAAMRDNYAVLKAQLGINNPQLEGSKISLRHELFRIKAPGTPPAPGEDPPDQAWRNELQSYWKDDLWEVPEFRRFCRPFAPRSTGKQPGLVIPFPIEILSERNVFGNPLGGADHSFDPTNYATRIFGVGVWFEDYNIGELTSTPRVYLIPAGTDIMTIPDSLDLETRQWNVVDQRIPAPHAINETDFRDPDWIPLRDMLSDPLGEIRRFSSFRAYGDFSGSEFIDDSELTYDLRLVGRSVSNTRWLLIIPSSNLAADDAQRSGVGLDRFINGNTAAGGSWDGVKDIKLHFQTFGFSGN